MERKKYFMTKQQKLQKKKKWMGEIEKGAKVNDKIPRNKKYFCFEIHALFLPFYYRYCHTHCCVLWKLFPLLPFCKRKKIMNNPHKFVISFFSSPYHYHHTEWGFIFCFLYLLRSIKSFPFIFLTKQFFLHCFRAWQ